LAQEPRFIQVFREITAERPLRALVSAEKGEGQIRQHPPEQHLLTRREKTGHAHNGAPLRAGQFFIEPGKEDAILRRLSHPVNSRLFIHSFIVPYFRKKAMVLVRWPILYYTKWDT